MSAHPPQVVELRDVHLSFDEKKVLDGVSLEVEPLDRFVIMGQSGSGKSTILRLILGLAWPDTGTVAVEPWACTATIPCTTPVGLWRSSTQTNHSRSTDSRRPSPTRPPRRRSSKPA